MPDINDFKEEIINDNHVPCCEKARPELHITLALSLMDGFSMGSRSEMSLSTLKIAIEELSVTQEYGVYWWEGDCFFLHHHHPYQYLQQIFAGEFLDFFFLSKRGCTRSMSYVKQLMSGLP